MKKHFFSLCLAAHATFQPMVVAQQSVDNTSDSDANSTVRNEVIDGGAINQNINSVRNEDDFEVKTKFGACSGQSNFLLKLNADQVLGTFDTTILGVAMEFNLGESSSIERDCAGLMEALKTQATIAVAKEMSDECATGRNYAELSDAFKNAVAVEDETLKFFDKSYISFVHQMAFVCPYLNVATPEPAPQ